ncbi:hypothetical protein D9U65_18715 [Vibrio cholerae]|nr:hypothetical protein [Vibrio cholerae]
MLCLRLVVMRCQPLRRALVFETLYLLSLTLHRGAIEDKLTIFNRCFVIVNFCYGTSYTSFGF